MKITTFDPRKKKQVLAGEYRDGMFFKTVKPCHYMRICQGYGIQEDVIRELVTKGCTYIIFHTATGDLTSKFSDWLRPEIKVMDFGNGKQRFLPDRFLTKGLK